jgi:hypothetical protein
MINAACLAAAALCQLLIASMCMLGYAEVFLRSRDEKTALASQTPMGLLGTMTVLFQAGALNALLFVLTLRSIGVGDSPRGLLVALFFSFGALGASCLSTLRYRRSYLEFFQLAVSGVGLISAAFPFFRAT